MTIQDIQEHLSNTFYTHKARNVIRYFLLGKGLIEETSEVKFKDHEWDESGYLKSEGKDFLHFYKWFWDNYSITDVIEEMAHSVDRCLKENSRPVIEYGDISVNDLVKVIDPSDPTLTHDEMVEGIATTDESGQNLYCLSDGTWTTRTYLVKYAVQGEERCKLIDKLNEVVK